MKFLLTESPCSRHEHEHEHEYGGRAVGAAAQGAGEAEARPAITGAELDLVLAGLHDSLGDARYTQVRLAALGVLLALVARKASAPLSDFVTPSEKRRDALRLQVRRQMQARQVHTASATGTRLL